MFYNSTNGFEYNDCISKGACSVSPNISSMQEVMFILLRQIAYYLIKLKEFDICKEDVIFDVISEIALIDAAKDLSEAQILDAFSKQYINLVKCRKEYLKTCKEKDVQCDDLKNLMKFSPKTSLSSILKRGDKEFIHKYKKFNFEKKYYAEILSGVIKSVCVNLLCLHELNQTCTSAEDEVLKALNLFNAHRVQAEKIRVSTDALAKCDVELLYLINASQVEKYGKIEKTDVSLSTRPNKAVMVSGSNLEDLRKVLEAVEGKEIDVYTNGNLIVAHAFPYFKNSKNLIGHFGTGSFNTILDFATFPGAILLTKNEAQNIEYLYRGRLFTTDDIAPKGVVKLENDDFTSLIESARQAKGFAKGQDRNSIVVGYDEDKFEEAIDNIINSNPDKIFIIGHSALSMHQKDYFKKFFSVMPKNSRAISFSYDPGLDNVLTVNLGNDYALIYSALHKILNKIPITSDKLAFFLTKCDVNSLSNIINLKNNGAKNIFLSDCPPTVINPAVLRAFNKLFAIHTITNPNDDLELLNKVE
ncbi:MAG TPA: hypothetical protein IAD11_02650 [Candidatus Stercorousia faecigallinarum]|nr:hypothetical protein [Candidatus Stercorousia faecigallinarum]